MIITAIERKIDWQANTMINECVETNIHPCNPALKLLREVKIKKYITSYKENKCRLYSNGSANKGLMLTTKNKV